MGFDTFEKVADNQYRCKTCGKIVQSGIINLSTHWSTCTGKEFTDAIMKHADKSKGVLTESDIKILQEQHLKSKDE